MPVETSAPAPTPAVPPGVAAPLEDSATLEALSAALSRPEGPRAKQLGLSETTVIRLEPAYFPDGCEWLRSKVGLLFGIAVAKPAVISYGPVPIPQMRIHAVRVVVELAALELGTLAELKLIFLGADGKPLAIAAEGKLRCDGGPRCIFKIPLDKFSRIFTAAVFVTPSVAEKRPILRTAWVELDG